VFDDITPFQEIRPEILDKPAYLFTPPVTWRYASRFADAEIVPTQPPLLHPER